MRILISGYYGFGNAGDEAILAGALSGLRRRLPEAEVVVLSADPPATHEMHRVTAVQRWHWPTIWREVGACDVLLQGGGGLVQDSTSQRSVLYYLGVLQAARVRRKPFVVLAQGVGPLSHGTSRWLTGRTFRRAAAISVRDDNSAGILVELGVPAEKITVTADLAALVEPAPAEDVAPCLPPKDGRPRIGLSLRHAGGGEAVIQAALSAARHLRESEDARIVPLALHATEDADLADRVAAEVGERPVGARQTLSAGRWTALVRSLDFVIAMRLHACIFAAAQATPFVALSYDPKVAAFATRVGAGWAPLEARPDEVLALVRRAWAGRETERPQREACADQLRAAAERNLDRVEAVITRRLP
jgi:polysaccharide pyruvyl transferase CsaB